MVGQPPVSETRTGLTPTPIPEGTEVREVEEMPTETPTAPPPDHSQRSLFAPIGPPFAMPSVPINKENVGALMPISFLGHVDVRAVKYSPNGKWLAIAGSSGVTVHDAQTLAQVFAFPITVIPEKYMEFDYLSFSHDGSLLLADNSARHTPSYFGLWEIPSGALVSLGPNEDIFAFNPVGPFLADAHSTVISIINWETGESVFSFTAGGNISRLIYSPKGQYLVAVTEIGVQVWNSENGEFIATLAEGGASSDIVFSPDGRYLAEAKDYDKIILWEVSAQRFATLVEEDFSPSRVTFASDGQTLISIGGMGSTWEKRAVKVWSVEMRSVIQSYEEEKLGNPFAVDFNPNTAEITIEWGGEVRFLDARSLQPTRSLPNAGRLIYSPDGTKIAHISWTAVSMWDATSTRLLWSHPDKSATVSFSPNSKYSAVGGHRGYTEGRSDVETLGGALGIYDTVSGNLLYRHHVEKDKYDNEWVFALTYSPDGRWLAVRSHNAIFWLDTNTQEFLPGTTEMAGSVVDWQPTGRLIAAGEDEKVVLIDAETKQVVKTLEGHNDAITDLTFSPDGKLVASSDRTGLIKLWDIEGGWELPSLEAGYENAYSIAFSPGGELLVSGGGGSSRRSAVQIWDVETGQQAFSVPELSDVYHVSFSPDGTQLAIESEIWGIRQY